jgi:hypothetical protein
MRIITQLTRGMINNRASHREYPALGRTFMPAMIHTIPDSSTRTTVPPPPDPRAADRTSMLDHLFADGIPYRLGEGFPPAFQASVDRPRSNPRHLAF